MTRIKFFYFSNESTRNIEDRVNEWIEERGSSIQIIDIKMQSYAASSGRECNDIMIIYEDAGHD